MNVLDEETDFDGWNLLPPEIKIKCVKWMDLKMRTNLRATAKLEKTIVDDMKFDIDTVTIKENYFVIQGLANAEYKESYIFQIKNDNDEVQIGKDIEHIAPLVEHIFRIGNIESLVIFQRPFTNRLHFADLLRDIPEPIRVTRISTHENELASTVVVLQKCCNSQEYISINLGEIHVIEMYLNQQMRNAGKKIFYNLGRVFWALLIKHWIDCNEEIGTVYVVEFYDIPTLTFLLKYLKQFLIAREAGLARFRTNNPEKEILLMSKDMNGFLHMGCAVIPKGLPRADYGNYIVFD